MSGSDTDDPWDDEPEEHVEESTLDAFLGYAPVAAEDAADDGTWDRDVADDGGADDGGADEGVLTLLFTASDPAGMISATTLLDGRVVQIKLSPRVSDLPEAELAKSISVVAGLAREQALAGQHAVVGHILGRIGHDPAATSSFIQRELRLPAPETVNARRAALFSDHYTRDCD